MSLPGSDREPVWRKPPNVMVLDQDAVHVWRWMLDPGSVHGGQAEKTLAVDELARANKFHFARDRLRYVAGRSILRSVLARYLHVPPAALEFRYGEHGRPTLHNHDRPSSLQFNLSRSGDVGVIAVTQDRLVGIDIERVRDLSDAHAIANRFFSSAEHAALSVLPESDYLKAFFAIWTRKEAYVKARGRGLTLSLESFEVQVDPGEARLLSIGGDLREASRWTLHELRPEPGYVGAIAVRGTGLCWEYWDWIPAPA